MSQLVVPCHKCGILPVDIGTYTLKEITEILSAYDRDIWDREMLENRRVARLCYVIASIFSSDTSPKLSENDFMPDTTYPRDRVVSQPDKRVDNEKLKDMAMLIHKTIKE